MSLDDDVLEYIRVTRLETDMLFSYWKWEAGGLDKMPDPPSVKLWFDGIKKHGRAFADREYELTKEMENDMDLDTTPATEKVLVEKDELESLKRDSMILGTLLSYGVDNWEGYDEAMRALEEV